jgi:hypothetical protein
MENKILPTWMFSTNLLGIQTLKGDIGRVEFLLHTLEEGNDGGDNSTVPPQSSLIVRFLRQSHELLTMDLMGYHILQTYLPKRLTSVDLGSPPMPETLIATIFL